MFCIHRSVTTQRSCQGAGKGVGSSGDVDRDPCPDPSSDGFGSTVPSLIGMGHCPGTGTGSGLSTSSTLPLHSYSHPSTHVVVSSTPFRHGKHTVYTNSVIPMGKYKHYPSRPSRDSSRVTDLPHSVSLPRPSTLYTGKGRGRRYVSGTSSSSKCFFFGDGR